MNKVLGMLVVAVLVLSTPVWPARTVRMITDEVGSHPTMIAMGNVEGMLDQSSSVFDNPAALGNGRNRKSTVSFMQSTLSDDGTKMLTASVAVPFGSGYLGVGAIMSTIGDLQATATDENDIFYVKNSFQTQDALYFAAYQFPIPIGFFGIGVKYYSQDLYESKGSGWNMDLGLVSKQGPLKLAFAMKNIWTSAKVNYNGGASLEFPAEFVMSGRYQFSEFGVMAQVKTISEGGLLLRSVGGDYTPLGLGKLLTLSAGWKEVPVAGVAYESMAMGVRLDLTLISLNFAYETSKYVEKNSKYYFSLDAAF